MSSPARPGVRPRSRTVPLREISEAERDRWLDLSLRAVEPNPFMDPRLLLTASRMLPGLDDILLVVVEDEEEWLAVCALSPMGRFRGTPLTYASTAGPYLARRAPLCVPLVKTERAAEAVATPIEHLSSGSSGLPGVIEMTLLPADGPVLAHIRAHCRSSGRRIEERARFSRAFLSKGSATSHDAHLSSSRRKTLRRLNRGLAAEVGELRFIDHGSDLATYELLLDLEAAGWKGRRGSAAKKKPDELAWMRASMSQFASEGGLKVMTLRSASHIVHASASLVVGGRAFGTIDAYDERFASFSPGTLGRMREQEQFVADQRIRDFDPCMHPRYAEATTLYPDRRELVSVLIGSKVSGDLLLRLRPLARRAAQISLRGERTS